MASRVVLHIGMMKSGTTFIQRRLSVNLGVLEQQGIAFPHPWSNQVAAVNDLIGRRASTGAWDEMVAEINATPGTVLLSMEFLVNLGARRIAQLSRDFDGAPVEAVVTVRDIGRSVPAMWQEGMQNRNGTSWPAYLKELQGSSLGRGRTFWRQQRADRIVERWVEGLGAEHVTIVTVPPPGAPQELLWDRFCQAVGLAPAEWAEGLRANESLGVRSALLMGLLNEHFADMDKATYNRKVKILGKFVLAERRSQEPKIGFVVPDWMREIAHEVNASLASSGARVIGDLAELEPHDVPGVDPTTVTTEELLEVAVETLAKIVETPAQQRAKQARKALRQQ